MGIGQTEECFQSMGRTSAEREELKMRERGVDIDKAVSTTIMAGIESKPSDILGGMQEKRLAMLSGIQSRLGGQGKGGGEDG